MTVEGKGKMMEKRGGKMEGANSTYERERASLPIVTSKPTDFMEMHV